ncbi:MAG: 2-dehydropantoate 2-reductase [Byssovorax sp.]
MRIGIFGAGAIGSYLGVRLSAAGAPVTLIARQALVEQRSSLRAVDLDGVACTPAPDLQITADPASLAEVDLCLLTVKSQDSAAAAPVLASSLRPGTPVLCFQNGIDNAARLREAGLDRPVIDGIVTFNVVREAPATFRQATSGPVYTGTLDPLPSPLQALAGAFSRTSIPFALRPDIAAVAAGKLLINLGNGLSAVTGLPTAQTLLSRPFRLCYADIIHEGLRAFAAAGRPVAPPDRVPLSLIARLLRLPTPLFSFIARSMVRVDPTARSSTLQDLDRGHPTEIDLLNGAIVSLAEAHGQKAPLNRWIVNTVHDLERAAQPLPHLSPEQVRAAFLTLA